jgi:hypothetical protein
MHTSNRSHYGSSFRSIENVLNVKSIIKMERPKKTEDIQKLRREVRLDWAGEAFIM